MIYNVQNSRRIPSDQWGSSIWRRAKEGKVIYLKYDAEKDFWVKQENVEELNEKWKAQGQS